MGALKRSALQRGWRRQLDGGDFRGRLGRQGEPQFIEQQLQLGLGLRVAREGELAAIGSGYEYIDHLYGRELLKHAARGEAWGERFELLSERDVQAVGEECDEDVRFDARLFLVEDGPDRQIALEGLEGGLDLVELQI